MIAQVMADLTSKIMPTTSQAVESGKSMVDTTFQEVFDSISQTTANTIEKNASKQASTNSKNENNSSAQKSDDSKDRDNSAAASSESKPEASKNAGEEKAAVNAKESDSSSSDNSSSNNTSGSADAINQIKEKLEALKEKDPAAYNDLIANAGSMTMNEILSKLGFDANQAASILSALNISENGQPSADILGAISETGSGSSDDMAVQAFGATEVSKTISGDESGAASQSNVQSESAPKTSSNAENSATVENTSADSGAGKQESNTSGQSDASRTAQTAATNESSAQTATIATVTPNPSAQAAKEALVTPVSSSVDTAQAAMQAGEQNANAAQQIGDKSAGSQGSKNPAEGVLNTNNTTSSTKTDSAPVTAKAPDAARQSFEKMLSNQVVEKAKIFIRPNGNTNMTLRLDPPSLGKIDMRLEVSENGVRAVMIAENREVKAALENNLDNLKNSLNQSGIKVDELSVATANDSGMRNGSFAKEAGMGNSGEKRNGHSAGRRNEGGFGGEDEMVATVRRSIHAGVLDIVA